jgi:hypothetical protein
MDYTRQISIQDEAIVVQFPFNTELIDELRSFRKDSQGTGEWDKEAKVWRYALTEYNLVWLTAWGQQREFRFDAEVVRLNSLIVQVEQTPYAIELVRDGDALSITNCPDTLHTYVVDHLGGFAETNLLRLVDMSAVLGYTVSREIGDELVQDLGPRYYNLFVNKDVHLDPASMADNLTSVLNYADVMKKWPVVIYEPDLGNKLLAQLRSLRPEDSIQAIVSRRHAMDTAAKYIHTVHPVSEAVPLLISSAGMIYGGDKSLMVQRAEKVVYCSAEVYNKAGVLKVTKIAG